MESSRLYQTVLQEHLARHRQMAFLSGPRQVGKTTLAKGLGGRSMNYDLPADRRMLADGEGLHADLGAWMAALPAKKRPVLVLDELHKHPRWKNLLKGLFDAFEPRLSLVVTGSAKLDHFRKGGDSLMGRYLSYRVHPFSLGELLWGRPPAKLWHEPGRKNESAWQALSRLGGFPEPLFKADDAFALQWRDLRRAQVLREDLRDLSRIRETGLVEQLLYLLDGRSATALNYAHLAQDIGSNPVSVKQWTQVMLGLYQGFLLSPWTRKVARSLSREPKWYSRDWGGVQDPGRRFETMVACHLLKSVELWTDLGRGRFDLHYIRNREHQEVDFLVTRDQKPWLLAEAKVSDKALSPTLRRFHEQLGAEHSFQVVENLPWTGRDAFAVKGPVLVGARDWLSQLA